MSSARETLHSSASAEWYTSPRLVEVARRVLYGIIELDPASTPIANSIVGAERIFTAADDGLSQEWDAVSVFLNPPGTKIGNRSGPGTWWQKLVDEYVAGHTQSAVYVGYRVDQLATLQEGYGEFTPFDAPFVILKDRVRFLAEREGVLVPGTAPTHGQWVAYLPPIDVYDEAVQHFTEVFGALGHVVLPSPRRPATCRPTTVRATRRRTT